jgi:hypothetical protein
VEQREAADRTHPDPLLGDVVDVGGEHDLAVVLLELVDELAHGLGRAHGSTRDDDQVGSGVHEDRGRLGGAAEHGHAVGRLLVLLRSGGQCTHDLVADPRLALEHPGHVVDVTDVPGDQHAVPERAAATCPLE